MKIHSLQIYALCIPYQLMLMQFFPPFPDTVQGEGTMDGNHLVCVSDMLSGELFHTLKCKKDAVE